MDFRSPSGLVVAVRVELRFEGLMLCHGPRADADPRGLAVGHLRRGIWIRTTVVNGHHDRHVAAVVSRAVVAFAARPLSAVAPRHAEIPGSLALDAESTVMQDGDLACTCLERTWEYCLVLSRRAVTCAPRKYYQEQ